MISILLCILLSLPALAIEVSGVALLEGQEDHSGIRVLFEAQSPSAVTDSVYTNGIGHYVIDVEPGVYNVFFTKMSFYEDSIQSLIAAENAILDTIVLLPTASTLSGALNGRIGPGDYLVIGNLLVEETDTLTILAGTRLQFNDDYAILIYGHMIAEGIETDSIHFTISTSNDDSSWGGMIFDDGTGDLSYCIVEYCSKDWGGALSVEGFASIYCRHCSFLNNTAEYGGAVSVQGHPESAIFEDCTFAYNESSFDGGAVFVSRILTTFSRCYFTDNVGDHGSAISASQSTTIEECVFRGNNNSYFGGTVSAHSNTQVIRCTFDQNYSSTGNEYGIAVYVASPSVSIINCVISNTGGYGIHFYNSLGCTVRYCDFWGNGEGNFLSPASGPPGLGTILTTNANGDSADTYYNIFEDPLFVDAEHGDYHLQAGSPCIDAGDPGTGLNPDGTVADIGAFYFPQVTAADQPEGVRPRSITLHQNYPNPFNATTEIRFDLPVSGAVRLQLFDINGRLVSTLIDDRLSAGAHISGFSGSALASGVYFYRLTLGQYQQTRKMVLLK